MIITCTCKNAFQDKMYGTNKRVANQMKNPQLARCTVCKKEVSVKSSTTPAEEKGK